jgi:ring-1,2-phenylacetyl-CoA epoxidase subunit PaaC
MHEALLSLWPLALGIFEPTAHDEALARLGIQPREADLRRQWEAVVEPVLDAAGLADAARGEPRYGGRTGDHPLEFVQLVDAMQKVYRLDPEALW